jgi:FkbM family methyltransferase
MTESKSKSVKFVDEFSGRRFQIIGSAADKSVVGPIESAGGTWEPHLINLFHRLIRPHDICLDIGANIGVHTLVMADLARSGRVYAFEPSSMSFAYLKQNLAKNHITNVTAFQLGLSSAAGPRSFHTLVDIPGASFASDPTIDRNIDRAIEDGLGYKFPYISESIEFSTLDEWALQYRIFPVRLLKMDVEGSEDFVVRGGEAFLAKSKPFLISEFNTKSLAHYFGIDPESYFNRLSNIYDYIYVVADSGELHRVRECGDVFAVLNDTKYWVDLLCSAVEMSENTYAPPMGLAIELETDIGASGSGASFADLQRQDFEDVSRSEPIEKIDVLYFTVVPLALASNGGTMCCRNHIEQLGLDPQIALTVVTAGPEDWAAGHGAFVRSLGCEFIHLPFEHSPRDGKTVPETMFFPQEKWSNEYSNLNERLVTLALELRPNVIVIDYLPSATYIQSIFNLPIPRVVVTLNREADFFREQCKAGQIPGLKRHLWIANLRFRFWERWVQRHCSGLVALSRNDLPTGLPADIVLETMAPTLGRSPASWSYRGNKDVFFVGNLGHYPNRLAMEWICTKLAVETEMLDSQIRFCLIGAAKDDVPESWRHPSVQFLGVADDAEVERRFTESALFVAPISNNFGSKMKLLQCLSHATPFVATVPALSGLPFLEGIETIDLKQPKKAAEYISRLLNEPEALAALSRHNDVATLRFQATQKGVWGRYLRRVIDSARESLQNSVGGFKNASGVFRSNPGAVEPRRRFRSSLL